MEEIGKGVIHFADFKVMMGINHWNRKPNACILSFIYRD